MTIDSHLFEGKQFVLDLSFDTGLKRKNELRDKITKNDGVVSYIVTKKSNYVVVSETTQDSSFKVSTARKYNLPVVRDEFVDKCVESGKLLKHEEYEVNKSKKYEEEEEKSWLEKGKIAVRGEEDVKSKMKFNLKSFRVWKYKDEAGPNFHQLEYKVVKMVMFKGKEKSFGVPFSLVEIHVGKNCEDEEFRFCVFNHRGFLPLSDRNLGEKDCRYFVSASDALSAYVQMCRQFSSPPNSMEKVLRIAKSHRHLGSDNLKFDKWVTTKPILTDKILSLVELLWAEAEDELNNILSVSWRNLNVEKIEEAMGLLLSIEKQSSSILEVIENYFQLIPHKRRVDLQDRKCLFEEFNLCQLIKDRIYVSEMTSDEDLSLEFKYSTLRCDIEVVSSNCKEFVEVCKLMTKADVVVKNLFRVTRENEDEDFLDEIGNEKHLFHATSTKNIVGIFSRGLLLPKIVSSSSKSSESSLGAGIYFADNFRAVKELVRPNKTRGTRFVLVHQVALGNCCDVFEKNPQLSKPPEGYQSVHGVKRDEDVTSEFDFDEYVIYNQHQQRIRYLVEFYSLGENINDNEKVDKKLRSKNETAEDEEKDDEVKLIDIDQLNRSNLQKSKNKVGLQATRGSGLVSLRKSAIFGRLCDLTAEVTILQEYVNESTSTIEAKYVFPVDEMAAVCSFEAFLNGRHVIGRVEEKQTAHREYKEAISKGKSALLMDQETPDVFTVTIGNIKPKETVIVKIIYVTELDLEGDLISFRLPSSLSQQEASTVSTSKLKTSLELSLEMPYDIKSVTSTSHRIKVKKTLTMATVQLVDEEEFNEKGFQLLVGLAEIHCPRMLTEDSEKGTQACMLTFYPEFNGQVENEVKVMIILDSSNSMADGSNFLTAQKVALLSLEKLHHRCWFNVVSFGCSMEECFSDCVENSLESIHEARKFISKQKANKGSSSIRHVLESIFDLAVEDKITNVVLISDGHLNDDIDVLYGNVRKNCNEKGLARIFTMAVGKSPNRHLMRGLARVGAGTYNLFQDGSKNITWAEKIERVMTHTQAPSVADITVDWQTFDNTRTPLVQAPRSVSTLFNGSRLVVYGMLVGGTTTMAELKARIPGGSEVRTVVAPYKSSTSRGKTIHRLATRAVVRDWEDGVLDVDRAEHEVRKLNLKPELIELSKFYSIVTPFTSFIAVDYEESSRLDVVFDDLVKEEKVDELRYLRYEDEVTVVGGKMEQSGGVVEEMDDVPVEEVDLGWKCLKKRKAKVAKMSKDEIGEDEIEIVGVMTGKVEKVLGQRDVVDFEDELRDLGLKVEQSGGVVKEMDDVPVEEVDLGWKCLKKRKAKVAKKAEDEIEEDKILEAVNVLASDVGKVLERDLGFEDQGDELSPEQQEAINYEQQLAILRELQGPINLKQQCAISRISARSSRLISSPTSEPSVQLPCELSSPTNYSARQLRKCTNPLEASNVEKVLERDLVSFEDQGDEISPLQQGASNFEQQCGRISRANARSSRLISSPTSEPSVQLPRELSSPINYSARQLRKCSNPLEESFKTSGPSELPPRQIGGGFGSPVPLSCTSFVPFMACCPTAPPTPLQVDSGFIPPPEVPKPPLFGQGISSENVFKPFGDSLGRSSGFNPQSFAPASAQSSFSFGTQAQSAMNAPPSLELGNKSGGGFEFGPPTTVTSVKSNDDDNVPELTALHFSECLETEEAANSNGRLVEYALVTSEDCNDPDSSSTEEDSRSVGEEVCDRANVDLCLIEEDCDQINAPSTKPQSSDSEDDASSSVEEDDDLGDSFKREIAVLERDSKLSYLDEASDCISRLRACGSTCDNSRDTKKMYKWECKKVKLTETIFFGGIWVDLEVGCVSFGNGLPFCLTLYKAFSKNDEMDAIPLSALTTSSKQDFEHIFLKYTKLDDLDELDEEDEELRVKMFPLIDIDKVPEKCDEQLWKEILQVLRAKGLNSLPKSSKNAVLEIIFTLGSVFNYVKNIDSSCFPLKLDSLTNIEKTVEKLSFMYEDEDLDWDEKRAVFLVFLMKIIFFNNKYPMLYRTMELGNCWEEAFQRLTNGRSLIED